MWRNLPKGERRRTKDERLRRWRSSFVLRPSAHHVARPNSHWYAILCGVASALAHRFEANKRMTNNPRFTPRAPALDQPSTLLDLPLAWRYLRTQWRRG